jgi:hypothetical protein
MGKGRVSYLSTSIQESEYLLRYDLESALDVRTLVNGSDGRDG